MANGDSDWTGPETVRAIKGLQNEVRQMSNRIDVLTFVRRDVYDANREADQAVVKAVIADQANHDAQHRWVNRALFVAVMGLVANVAAVLAGKF